MRSKFFRVVMTHGRGLLIFSLIGVLGTVTLLHIAGRGPKSRTGGGTSRPNPAQSGRSVDASSPKAATEDLQPVSSPSIKPPAGSRPAGTVVSAWLDPEGKSPRRRVRIERAEFKFPLLRKVEEVWRDPRSGTRKTLLLEASVADHVMVGLHEDVSEERARRELERRGFVVRASEPGSFLLVEVNAARTIDGQAATLDALAALDEFIEFSEPDYLLWPSAVPDDPAFVEGKLWGLDNEGTEGGATDDWDIDAREGWDVRADAGNIVVAVIDTGINYRHEDLVDNLWTNRDEVSGDGVDNDGNGVVDDVHGFNAILNTGDPLDDHGHGTHCAGTIGARGNNGVGMTGVAWRTQLMGVRFFGPDGGTYSDVIRGLNYARREGADIINGSFGGRHYSTGLRNAVAACGEAGIALIAAAGNNASNNDETPFYPSNYNLPNVISVAAARGGDRLAAYSNYGRYSVDVLAPGSNIWSTSSGGVDEYQYLTGTSMAAPHVTGALALALAEFPDETPADLTARLWSSVDPVRSLEPKLAMRGRLSLGNLLTSSTADAAHDDFANALQFEGNYGRWAGSNKRATREGDEDAFATRDSGVRSLWFAWQAPFEGLLRFEVETEASEVRVVAFKGNNKTRLVPVADSLEQHSGRSKRLLFHTEGGAEYRFLVDSPSTSGESLITSMELVAANDILSAAEELSGATFTATASSRGATAEPFEMERPHAGLGRGQSLWWKWTPQFSGEFVVDTVGTGFDTVLAVYTGDPDMPESFTEVGANDDRSGLDWTSQVLFEADAGTTYYIAVDSYREDAEGEVLLTGFRVGEISFVLEPRSVEAELGERVQLNAAVAGVALHYQWELDGEPIPGAVGPAYTIPAVTPVHFGDYQLRVTDLASEAVSAAAVLSEHRVEPTLRWASQSQVAGSGETVTLGVEATGSQPLNYQWSKDETELPGETGPRLRLESVGPESAGDYRVTVANSEGSISSELIRLAIADSPWEEWQSLNGRSRDGRIEKIVHGNGLWMALASTGGASGVAIHISTDGRSWQTNLPEGEPGKTYYARSLAFGNGTFVVTAEDTATGDGRVFLSDDGVRWTTQFPVLGQESAALRRIVFHRGYFYATSNSNRVYRSQLGRSWTQMQSGANPVLATGLIPGGPALVSHQKFTSDLWVLPDGGNWQLVSGFDASGFDNGVWFDGRFHIYGDQRHISSSNGVNWEEEFLLDNGGVRDEEGVFAVLGSKLVRVSRSRYSTTTNGIDWEERLFPFDPVEPVIAVANGQIVLGTFWGGLFAGPSLDELETPTLGQRFEGSVLKFGNDTWFIYGDTSDDVFYSRDGESWSYGERIRTDTGAPLRLLEIFAGAGQFWMEGDWRDEIRSWKGVVPHWYSEAALTEDPADFLTALTEGPLGLLAVAGNGRNDAVLLSSQDGTNWDEVEFPGTVRQRMSVGFGGDLYFAASWEGTWASSDLVNWVEIGDIRVDSLIRHDGEYWGHHDDRYFARSRDGLTWEIWTPDGLDVGSVPKIRTFNGMMVALLDSGQLRYSPDGIRWVPVELGFEVADFEVGDGMLIALGRDGELVRSGRPAALAPVVEIVDPGPGVTVVTGSRLRVEANVFDPDGDSPTTVRCFRGPEQVGELNKEPFVFDVEFPDDGLHAIRVEAEDSDGLLGDDSLLVQSSPPRPNELIVSGQGLSEPQPHEQMRVLDGVIYHFADGKMRRSVDGMHWENLPMPFLPKGALKVLDVFWHNGTLLISLDAPQILVSRNGIDWAFIQLGDEGEGMFRLGDSFVAFRMSGTRLHRYISRDGWNWDREPTLTPVPDLTTLAGDLSGVMMGWEDNQERLYRSGDGGLSWEDVPLFNGRATALVRSGSSFVTLVDGSGNDPRIGVSEDGIDWSWIRPADVPSHLIEAGDQVFGFGSTMLGVLREGPNWIETTAPVAYDQFAWGDDGHYYSTLERESETRVVRSQNGLNWEDVAPAGPGGTLVPAIGTLLTRDEAEILWALDKDGTWEPFSDGQPLPSQKRIRDMAQEGDRFVAVGENSNIFTSGDAGRTWTEGRFEFRPHDADFYRVESRGGVFLAWSFGKTFYRSVGGEDWTNVTIDFGQLGITAVAASPDGWIALLEDGGTLASDDGKDWSELAPPGTLPAATPGIVRRVKSRWVAVPNTGEGGNIFTSPDGVSWTDTGQTVSGSAAQTGIVESAAGVLVTGRSEQLFTPDFVNWTSISPRYSDRPAFATSTDFLIVDDGNVYRTKDGEGWELWQTLPREFERGDAVGDRIFLFSGDSVIELTDHDFDVSRISVEQRQYAVGETLEMGFRITAGNSPSAARETSFEVRLSRDSYFGNADDIVLGKRPVLIPDLTAEGNADLAVEIELPPHVEAGDFRVGLTLLAGTGTPEGFLGNNSFLEAEHSVMIPGWRLNVESLGDGEVLRDQAALLYANGAQVALSAQAGKGASFARWGGDAAGSLSELTVAMDRNKSVEAHFTPVVNLQVRVRGLGDVQGANGEGGYTIGETATLEAVSAEGWVFAGWDGALSGGDSSASLVMDTSKSVTARFVLPYENWRVLHFSAAELADETTSGASADADGDGIPNRREHLHGSDPRHPSERGIVSLRAQGEWLTLTYTRLQGLEDGQSVRALGSRGMTRWDTANLQERILAVETGVETVEARLPMADYEKGFLGIEYMPAAP